MLVNTQETTVVYPSKPPFSDDHVLPLSHLDTDRNLHVLFRYLRVYVSSTDQDKFESDNRPFRVITSALSSALVKYYQYAGSLRGRSNDGRLELHCQIGKGVPVVRARVQNCQLSSIKYLDDDSVDEELIEKLVPNPDRNEMMIHPMNLQITMFGCGGFVLGAAIHHSLCDGIGATQFFNFMAELARGSSSASDHQPIWDRQILLGPRNPPRIEFPIHEFLNLDRNFVPYSEKTCPVVRKIFNVKNSWLDQLKGALFQQSGSKFTTFEALGAFIWRARAKASKLVGADDKLKFAYSINIRKLVKPALPAGYWGNGCVPMYVQLTAGDLLQQPLSKTADSIKNSKNKVSDEYVRSFIDFQELHFREGITAGKSISGFTDWRHLGHSSVDFGWGGPVTVLPLSRNLLGSVEPCFFLPYSSAIREEGKGENDGFKILVYLQEDAVSAFNEEMEKLKKNVDLGLL